MAMVSWPRTRPAPLAQADASLYTRLFIIQGAISIGIAGAAFFCLPDSPLQTRWLTPEERQLAHNRIFSDTTGRREGTSVMTGLIEAASDWRTWVFCLMDNLHLSANGFKNFLPSVMETLGYNTTVTLVLTCPPYLVAGVVSILTAWSSGRTSPSARPSPLRASCCPAPRSTSLRASSASFSSWGQRTA
jgi:hypothetical protein